MGIKTTADYVRDGIGDYVNDVAGKVLIFCTVQAVLVLGLLWYQTDKLHDDPDMVTLRPGPAVAAACIENPTSETCKSDATLFGELVARSTDTNFATRAALEYDAQFLRTKRHQSLLASRVFIQSIAIIAGLTLMLLGSALVFARVSSGKPSMGEIVIGRRSRAMAEGLEAMAEGDAPPDPEELGDAPTSRASLSAMLATDFPGLLIAGMGTLVICATLLTTVYTGIRVNDHPLFVKAITANPSTVVVPATQEEIEKTEEAIGEILDEYG